MHHRLIGSQVKYTFSLPTYDLRHQYVTNWLSRVAEPREGTGPTITFSDQELLAEYLAHETEGFSFAFLQELFLSFLLAYAHSVSVATPIDSEELLRKQVEQTKKQVQLEFRTKEGDEKPQAEQAKEVKETRQAGNPAEVLPTKRHPESEVERSDTENNGFVEILRSVFVEWKRYFTRAS